MAQAAFPRVFQPLVVNNIKFKNRMLKTPNDLNLADAEGGITQALLDFYESIAKGGIGGIILEQSAVVTPEGTREGMISVAEDKLLPGLTKLADTIHKYNCPVVVQINHLGPNAHFPPHPLHADFQAVGPSALDEERTNLLFHGHKEWKLRPLTISHIKEIVHKFAEAAERVKRAGFDGVELHGDHLYLINSFLSRVWNLRDDEYGPQSIENRVRFVAEVLRACRARVGPAFVIGVKLNGAEYGHEQGTTIEDCQQFAKILEAESADYFNIQGDGYGKYGRVSIAEQLFYPEPPKPMLKELEGMDVRVGMNIHLAAKVKKGVHIPVFAVGRLDAHLAEKIIEKGQADGVLIGRRLIADPEYPNKVANGEEDYVRPCTCCITCETRMFEYDGVACMVNASLGRGVEGVFPPNGKPKKAVIVGGGPAGMEAARVMKLRGHEVTLYEKASRLGGLLHLASVVKGVELFALPELVQYFERELDRLNVTVRLGQEYTPELNETIKPDIVVVATGGVPASLKLPGIDSDKVLTTEELHRRVKLPLRLLGPQLMEALTKIQLPVGKQVVVIGGGIFGCEVAEFLVKRGRKVTIVEETDQIGMEIPYLQRILLVPWLREKGTPILTEVKYDKITREGLTIMDKKGVKQTLKANNIIVALPPRPNTGLFDALQGKGQKTFMIGDCKRGPGLIMNAIADGYKIGCSV